MNKPKVLFLCTGNSARSQMAEAFLRKYGGDKFEVFSAGFEPQGINPFTRTVMVEKDFDLADQHSKSVQEYLGKMNFDYLITVCNKAEQDCPIAFPGVRHRLFWPFEDPAAQQGLEKEKLEKFRQIRDQIEGRIKLWLQEQP
ncbi:MAG: arsenate reductase ArsC [Deltaproteobacteria bacterium]|nr:arsenate reductase ArsC [Deltaproteobacteria bacterium]